MIDTQRNIYCLQLTSALKKELECMIPVDTVLIIGNQLVVSHAGDTISVDIKEFFDTGWNYFQCDNLDEFLDDNVDQLIDMIMQESNW